MGTNLKDLLVMKEISMTDLKGKKLAVDTFNILYQFLATIRQRDGSLEVVLLDPIEYAMEEAIASVVL